VATTSRPTRGSVEFRAAVVTARAAALHALVELERGRQPRLRAALDAARLDGREQALANELAHGVLRRERLLDHVLAGLAVRGLPRDARLMAALRLGVYQLLFVAGMPVHAAVHETVELVRSNRGFANALLRQVAPDESRLTVAGVLKHAAVKGVKTRHAELLSNAEAAA
jgi:16S rRNA (cytosine967-C5)-methyltransferase